MVFWPVVSSVFLVTGHMPANIFADREKIPWMHAILKMTNACNHQACIAQWSSLVEPSGTRHYIQIDGDKHSTDQHLGTSWNPHTATFIHAKLVSPHTTRPHPVGSATPNPTYRHRLRGRRWQKQGLSSLGFGQRNHTMRRGWKEGHHPDQDLGIWPPKVFVCWYGNRKKNRSILPMHTQYHLFVHCMQTQRHIISHGWLVDSHKYDSFVIEPMKLFLVTMLGCYKRETTGITYSPSKFVRSVSFMLKVATNFWPCILVDDIKPSVSWHHLSVSRHSSLVIE
jgi:hypothetical protein